MPAVVIFANPIAGRGMGRRLAMRAATDLTASGYSIRVILNRAGDVADADLPDQPRAIVSIGGDGTLRAVVERLIQRYSGDNVPPILVMSLGTANLMARHLELKYTDGLEGASAVQLITALRTRKLDVATSNGTPFLLMAGVGIDGRIIHELDRLRSGPISIFSYAVPSLRAFLDHDYTPLTVELDGRIEIRDEPAMAFVGNIREYGTGFPILPHAVPDDGLLDVCIVKCKHPLQVPGLFLRIAAQQHSSDPAIVMLRGKRVKLTSARPVPLQLDGEAFGHTPAEIELLPFRVPFIVPG